MRLAIMQPYIFPYIGYFQLISAVDKFVFYDDVNFIKQGWVNRNRILVNGKDHLFTVPLVKQSSFTKIGDTMIDKAQYKVWKKKFYKTLIQTYKKAPLFDEVYPIVESVLEGDSETIAAMAKSSIWKVCDYLELDKKWENSSVVYKNEHLKAQERVLDICRTEKASVYINPTGGMELYSEHDFDQSQLKLYFLKSNKIGYKQYNEPFVPWLSIIDVIMFNSVENTKAYLGQYELV